MSQQDVEFITQNDEYPELLPSQKNIYIGAHLALNSIFEQMEELGASGAAFFVSQPQSWQINLTQLRTKASIFYQRAAKGNFKREQFLPHAPYVLNLISFQERVREASLKRLLVETFIVRMMGLDRLNIHPGTGDTSGSQTIADAINTVHDIVPDVSIVLETMAGNQQGSAFGSTFEQLKAIIDAVSDQSRVGVCIDTQHTFAGAFAAMDGFSNSLISSFDQQIGRQFLKGFHVNNSLTQYASHIDRHAPLATGKID